MRRTLSKTEVHRMGLVSFYPSGCPWSATSTAQHAWRHGLWTQDQRVVPHTLPPPKWRESRQIECCSIDNCATARSIAHFSERILCSPVFLHLSHKKQPLLFCEFLLRSHSNLQCGRIREKKKSNSSYTPETTHQSQRNTQSRGTSLITAETSFNGLTIIKVDSDAGALTLELTACGVRTSQIV
ncbi:hypothetical protein M501DRAFT_407473 [Patellaria atrata CBS 101060]|uniref:Uncharacterized protein n=1 Tax=Patellaria atrata CBS 101060 TaxID=1346257 RepID=A0A9P4VUA9_9PEZI|nr:hypothetical protein M501DRAFT_407473 [Patellaria atrata CBS 101060]